MKVRVKFLSVFMITVLIWSALSLGFSVSADENLDISITFEKTELCVGETYSPVVI